MREILFRGKFTKTGEWVYGSAYCSAEKTIIIEVSETMPTRIEGKYVIPKTVGQYTGLTDKKNGKKVFEGDIVRMHYTDEYTEVGFIRYSNCCCRFFFVDPLTVEYGFDETDVFEVIGNIHDNPELLKGGAE